MKKIFPIFGMVLFIFGMVFIFWGYNELKGTHLSSYTVRLDKIHANQQSAENKEEQSAIITYNVEEIHSIDEDEVVIARFRELTGLSQNLMIGGIWIPEVSLNLPIYKGFGNDHQYLGACTYYERVLGKDNYVLLGHNMLDQGQLFSPLKRVEQGMLIYVTDYQKVYLFQVVFKEVVYEDREDLVENDLLDGQTPLITLITCYGGYNTDKRTVVRGTLISEESLEHSEKVVKEVFKIE